MRPSLASLAAILGAPILMASCATSANWVGGGPSADDKRCSVGAPCYVDVTVRKPKWTTNCYYQSEDIYVGQVTKVDITWNLVDKNGDPAHRYLFGPNETGVVITPPDGYAFKANSGKEFTWYHDFQADDADDKVNFYITLGDTTCMPWHANTNPYIRNR